MGEIVVQLFEIMLKDILNLGGQHWEKQMKSSRKTPGGQGDCENSEAAGFNGHFWSSVEFSASYSGKFC